MNPHILEDLDNVVFIALTKQIEGKSLLSIRGTGILLKDLKLITCAHIYDEIPEIERSNIFAGIIEKSNRKLKKYNFFPIKPHKRNGERDIEIFNVEDKEMKLSSYGIEKDKLMDVAELESLIPSQDLYYPGFPLANELLNMNMGVTLIVNQCSLGSIKYRTKDETIDFILIDRQVNPGSSGSPVYFNGKIMGLASGTLNQTHAVGGNVINVPLGLGIIRTSNYILELLT